MIRIPSRAVSRLAWAGLVSLAGLIPSAAPASAATPVEQTLPSTTLALVKVDNTAALREAFDRSQIGQLLADPALAPLKEDVRGKFEEQNAGLKQRFGLTIADLLELPQGPGWLAVVVRDNARPAVALLLSVDVGANRPKMQELMDRATKEAEAAGSKVGTEAFQGGTLHLVDPPQEPGQELPSLRAWTSREGVFTFATNVDALKEVLAHPQGRTDSLAANESFVTVQERIGRDAQLAWFVDFGQLFQRLAQGAEAQGDNAAQIMAMLELWGITSLKAGGGGHSFQAGEFDSVSKYYVHAPGAGAGLVRLLQLPPADLRPAPWVPAAVTNYRSISWDLDKAYLALKDLAAAAGVAIEQFERDLAGPGSAPLSFQKDLTGPLGDRVTVVSDFKRPVTEQSHRLLVATELEDAAAFQNTLNKLIKLVDAAPRQREFKGTTIYDFDLGVQQAGPAGGLRGSLSVAIAQNQLFAASNPALLEQVLRGEGSPLAEDATFQQVARQIPDRVSSYIFVKSESFLGSEEQALLLYDRAKKGQLEDVLDRFNMLGGPDVPRAGIRIDPEKLPEFSVIAKYFSPGGGYSMRDEDGLTLTRFTLRKNTNP